MSRRPDFNSRDSSSEEGTPDFHTDDEAVYVLGNDRGDALPGIGSIPPPPGRTIKIPGRPTLSSLGWTSDFLLLDRFYSKNITSFDGPHWRLNSDRRPTADLPAKVYPDDEAQPESLVPTAEFHTQPALSNSQTYKPPSTEPGEYLDSFYSRAPLEADAIKQHIPFAQTHYNTSEIKRDPSQPHPFHRATAQPGYHQLGYTITPHTDQWLPQYLTQTEADMAEYGRSYYHPESSVQGESAQSFSSYAEQNPQSKRPHRSDRQPSTKDADHSVNAKEKGKRYSCRHPNCDETFGRLADVDRHMSARHVQKPPRYNCDYSNCLRAIEPFQRRDHYIEHLREYHKEDLSRRRNKREGEESEEWWSERVISKNWWRCYKCLRRVIIDQSEWNCPDCKEWCSSRRRTERGTHP